MIEHAVDTAIGTLLATITGLKVVTGMEDNSPALETPYCAVWSNVTESMGGGPLIYKLVTTVEYNSISGQDTVGDVDTMMDSIDALLTISGEPSGDILAVLPLTGLDTLGWFGIARTQQQVGDRRKSMRELEVIAQLT